MFRDNLGLATLEASMLAVVDYVYSMRWWSVWSDVDPSWMIAWMDVDSD